MAIFKNILIGSICAAFTLTAIPAMSEAAKTAKKDKRSMMTETQKKDVRRRAREYCNKTPRGGLLLKAWIFCRLARSSAGFAVNSTYLSDSPLMPPRAIAAQHSGRDPS
jgi:hypothetical protein